MLWNDSSGPGGILAPVVLGKSISFGKVKKDLKKTPNQQQMNKSKKLNWGKKGLEKK